MKMVLELMWSILFVAFWIFVPAGVLVFGAAAIFADSPLAGTWLFGVVSVFLLVPLFILISVFIVVARLSGRYIRNRKLDRVLRGDFT